MEYTNVLRLLPDSVYEYSLCLCFVFVFVFVFSYGLPPASVYEYSTSLCFLLEQMKTWVIWSGWECASENLHPLLCLPFQFTSFFKAFEVKEVEGEQQAF